MLLVLGFAGLAPSVLLPEWRAYQALSIREQYERHQLEQLRNAVEREERGLEALQTDPAAIARLARRDLRFHRPGELTVYVPIEPRSNARDIPFVPAAVAPPHWLARWDRFLPPLDYDAVFCHEETRVVLMAMSLGLIAVAMILYRRGL